MQYRDFGKTGYQVSAFGMGCMRLPRIADNEAQVDREKAYEMIRYAAGQGVNYFDTVMGYHNGTSEEVLGEALEGGLREKVKIATKQPLFAMKTHDDIRKNLEATLKKLRTGYIDLYLIHGINPRSWEEVKSKKVIEEFEKFRSEGLIRGIAFSYHGHYDGFKTVLEFYDWAMCLLQQNLIDVNRETTQEGIRLAGTKGCALAIMEPLRGGNLACPPPQVQALYDSFPVKRSAVEWAFRHLLDNPEVSTILSGVSSLEQLRDNIAIFSKPESTALCLSQTEKDIIAKVRETYASVIAIPCTGCEYCLPCPQGVNIPHVFVKYNDGCRFGTFEPSRRGYHFQTQFKADASLCIQCGECEKKCPQEIAIVQELKTAHEKLKGWIE